jgi:hypothetical protein
VGLEPFTIVVPIQALQERDGLFGQHSAAELSITKILSPSPSGRGLGEGLSEHPFLSSVVLGNTKRAQEILRVKLRTLPSKRREETKQL